MEGYQKNTAFNEYEYWGSKEAALTSDGQTALAVINRHTPYCEDFWFEKDGVRLDKVLPGSTVTAKATIRNNDTSVSSRQIRIDSSWRYGASGSGTAFPVYTDTIGKNTAKAITLGTITLSSSVEDDVQAYIKTEAYFSGWSLTDAWPWGKRFEATTGAKPTVGSVLISALDGGSVSPIVPGKRYIVSAEFNDDDGQGDITTAWVKLKNPNTSRIISVGYSFANGGMKLVDDADQGICIDDGGEATPVQDDYACLTHVEKESINSGKGWRLKFIFWMTAKWPNSSSGLDFQGDVYDLANHHEPGSWLHKSVNFEPLSLEAGKWTIIVHGKSNSPHNNIRLGGLVSPFGFGPSFWDFDTSEWFDAKSTPMYGSRLDEGWAFRMAQKLGRISKAPIKVHRLKSQQSFLLETWNNPFNEDEGYGAYSEDDEHHNVLLFEWDDPSDYVECDSLVVDDDKADNWYAYAAADALYALAKKQGFESRLNTLIGYSRGGIVVSDFTRRVLREGYQDFQLVYLDAEGWGEFDNEIRPTDFPVGFGNIKFTIDAVAASGVKYVSTLAEIIKYYSDSVLPPALRDYVADNATELSLLKDVMDFGYADCQFYAWKGTRSDQYRETYSNLGSAFCGAEVLIGGGNDRTVEYWPEYSTATNYIPEDDLCDDPNEISHSHYPHYLTDWCYLSVDADFDNEICLETPQLNSDSGLNYPTKEADAPENMLGEVFNGSFKDGSAAGWTYHGGTTPMGVYEDIYSFGYNNYAAYLTFASLADITHNWQYVPESVRSVRYWIEGTPLSFVNDEAQFYSWFGTDHYIHFLDVQEVQDINWNAKTVTVPFDDSGAVGQLGFFARNLNIDNAVYIDDVQYISLEPPSILTCNVTPTSVYQGDVLTFVAGGVSAGDASVPTVDFYWDKNANGQLDAGEEKMATAYGSGSTWQATGTSANLDLGDCWFIAIATDSEGLSSSPIGSNKVTVQQPVNQLPVIGSLDCLGSVDRGANLTLTATGVLDPDGGTVTRVEFYYDSNQNGVLDDNDDNFDTDYSGGTTATGEFNTIDLSEETQTVMFFAVAYDEEGARSGAVSCRCTVIQKWTLEYDMIGNGSVSGNPVAGDYPDGTKVQATATAAVGWSFVRWEANGSETSLPLWLHGDTTVTAVFQDNGGVGVVVPVINTIGTKSTGLGQAFSYTPTLQQGAPVTWSLETKPSNMVINATSGKIDWPNPQPGDSAHIVSVKALNSAGSDTESFTLYVTAPRYTLTVNNGSGGGDYPEGRDVTISATAQPDGVFDHWSGDTAYLDHADVSPAKVTMPAVPVTITANFRPAPDLVATNGTYAGQRYLHGDSLSVSVTETNIGTAAASETFVVQLALSTDRVWSNGNDYVVATNFVTGMAQNGGLVADLDYVIPTNTTIPDGFYYLGVMIDATNSVVEIKEDNNVWWSLTADVEIHTQPPLEAINLSPIGAGADRDVTLRWNDGGYASSYRVLFGTSPASLKEYPLGASLGDSSYRIGMREPDSTFWWKVISINHDGATTNATAVSFTTRADATFDEAVDNNLVWNTSVIDAPWFSQTITTHDGEDAMQSGAIGDNQASVLETTVEGPGTNIFWWKVSSEANKDFLDYYVGTNLIPEASISGDQDWVKVTSIVPFGTQALTWQYAKDGVGSVGSDAGWLDQVDWNPVNKVTVPLSGFAGRTIAVYLWHHDPDGGGSWRFLEQGSNITQVVVDNIRSGDWYWLCVMEFDGANWNLAHGSWINRTQTHGE